MIDWIISFLGSAYTPGFIGMILNDIYRIFAVIPWTSLIKVLAFLTLIVVHLALAFYVNDLIYLHFSDHRMREHHLTIKNDGNTSSVYLLHAVDLPQQLQIDFASGGDPMIYMTQKKKEAAPAEEKQPDPSEAQPAADTPADAGKQPAAGKTSGDGVLIPNLNDPMKPIETVQKTTTNVGRKAGLVASIIGTLTSLLPIKSKTLSDASDALKGVQQTSSEAVGTINNKVTSAGTLKSQVGSLVPKSAKDDAKSGRKDSGNRQPEQPDDRSAGSSRISDAVRDLTHLPDFIYDEKVWRKKVGKTDESGNSLIYAQTRVLGPGESIKIDLKLRNHARTYDAVSRMYKIEITQVPQTRMHLAAPRKSVTGIVSFPQIPSMEQHVPPALMIGQIILSALVVALCGKFIFGA